MGMYFGQSEIDRCGLMGDVLDTQCKILHALRILHEGNGDGARVLNDVGFNKLDGPFGKDMYERVHRDLGLFPSRYMQLWKMMRKYRNTQLKRAGIEYPTEEEANALVDALIGVEEKEKGLRPDPTFYNIELARNVAQGGRTLDAQLRIRFQYDKEIVGWIKRGPYQTHFTTSAGFRGGDRDPYGPCWYLAIEALSDIVREHPEWTISPDLREKTLYVATPEMIMAAAAAQGHTAPMEPIGSQPMLTDCPF